MKKEERLIGRTINKEKGERSVSNIGFKEGGRGTKGRRKVVGIPRESGKKITRKARERGQRV